MAIFVNKLKKNHVGWFRKILGIHPSYPFCDSSSKMTIKMIILAFLGIQTRYNLFDIIYAIYYVDYVLQLVQAVYILSTKCSSFQNLVLQEFKLSRFWTKETRFWFNEGPYRHPRTEYVQNVLLSRERGRTRTKNCLLWQKLT